MVSISALFEYKVEFLNVHGDVSRPQCHHFARVVATYLKLYHPLCCPTWIIFLP